MVLAAAMGAYLLAGGLGLILTGLVGIVCKGGGFNSINNGPATAIFLPRMVKKAQESQTTPQAVRPAHYHFIDLAICFALIVVGYFRLDAKGLIFTLG